MLPCFEGIQTFCAIQESGSTHQPNSNLLEFKLVLWDVVLLTEHLHGQGFNIYKGENMTHGEPSQSARQRRVERKGTRPRRRTVLHVMTIHYDIPLDKTSDMYWYVSSRLVSEVDV